MPIDSRIALGVQPVQLPNPLTNALRVQQLQGAQQAQQMNALQMQKYQRDMAQEETVRNALRTGGNLLDVAKQTGDIGLYRTAATLTKEDAIRRKNEIEGEARKLALISQVVGGAKTQEQLDQAKTFVRTLMTDAEDLADIDKITLENAPLLAQAGMTQAQRMTAEYQAATLEGAKEGRADKRAYQAGMLGVRQREVDRDTTNDAKRLRLDQQKADAATTRAKAAERAAGLKSSTAEEKKTGYLVGRALNALDRISDAKAKDPDAERPGALEAVTAAAPFVGRDSGMTNLARSGSRQIAYGAQVDLIDTFLTLATGAAYNKEQLAGQVAAYMPQWSDRAETVKTKQKAMLDLIQSAKVRAGRDWTPAMDEKVARLMTEYETGKSAPSAPASSGGEFLGFED